MNYAKTRDRAGAKIAQYGTKFRAYITDRNSGAQSQQEFSMLYLKKVKHADETALYAVGDYQYLAQGIEGYTPKEGDRLRNLATNEDLIVSDTDAISPGPVAVSHYVYLRRG
jgi:hypothetical protein